ncbi:hypothetical protein IC617_08810 [Neiella sp. HB171785]|uniref:Uncharacterized protein n=1 Tax=Neiella litorisoli TaxID=2771431 RepID=A0A8J6QU80_9GAMM|nr:hypothetical protein [Neiella litorisoli]MBD1389527.1 hypothetical protein [Neiella litorisoli]
MGQGLPVKVVEASLLEDNQNGKRVVKSVLLEFGRGGDYIGSEPTLRKEISIEAARELADQLNKSLQFLDDNPQLKISER